eukprot:gene11011-3082_t
MTSHNIISLWDSLDHKAERLAVLEGNLFSKLDSTLDALEQCDETQLKQNLKSYPILLNVDCDHGGNTLLHLAVLQNKPKLVHHLLELGASPITLNRAGLTAAHLACVRDSTIECLKCLLPIVGDNIIDIYGRTPLHTAVKRNSLSCIEALCRSCPQLVNQPDRSSMMPVHVAALCISAAVTETLIHHGCDVNATTNDERTPLHVLAEFGAASPKETMGVAYILLRHGANPDMQDSMGRTPMVLSAAFDNVSLACSLFIFDADVSTVHIRESFCKVLLKQHSTQTIAMCNALKLCTEAKVVSEATLNLVEASVGHGRIINLSFIITLQDLCCQKLLDLHKNCLPSLFSLELPAAIIARLFFHKPELYIPALARSQRLQRLSDLQV